MLCASESYCPGFFARMRIVNRSTVSGEAPQVPVVSPKSGMSRSQAQSSFIRLIASRQRFRKTSHRGIYCREWKGSSKWRGTLGRRTHRSQKPARCPTSTSYPHIHSLIAQRISRRMGCAGARNLHIASDPCPDATGAERSSLPARCCCTSHCEVNKGKRRSSRRFVQGDC
jgi:hypothetical protein